MNERRVREIEEVGELGKNECPFSVESWHKDRKLSFCLQSQELAVASRDRDQDTIGSVTGNKSQAGGCSEMLLAAAPRPGFDPWSQIPWKGIATTLVILPEMAWREEPGGYGPWGHQEPDMTERLVYHTVPMSQVAALQPHG